MWKTKQFSELTLEELFEIYRVRSEVFVEEQHIVYTDPDENDKQALHVFETDGKTITAYARIFKDGDHVTFGRVLTIQQVRGTGKGKELLEYILKVIKEHFPNTRVKIDAQAHAVGYYEKGGFKVTSESFIEAGIDHIKMEY
ncbi:GNAT family N-acetyltransferase [Apilactobacillus kunkeei]|uniref:GNAT family N-acetyltransferase n=1 Tax=Apilactobacillus kunkeei TaxID=148814 RepID=UPI0006C47C9B|nr:GNAT family N-acetyltransferase [Apilactobacillus kunkeei]KOY72002.1 Acetyltransferase, GNAT family [Apilactobacillus kunkeei]